MPELIESYQSRIDVLQKDKWEASMRYEQGVLDALLHRVPDEEILSLIGRHFIQSLIMIRSHNNTDLQLALVGEYDDDLNCTTIELSNILLDLSSNEQVKRLGSIIEHQVKDVTADWLFGEADIALSIDRESILLVEQRIEYLEEFQYEVSYEANQRYELFYARLKRVFEINIEELVSKLFTGEYVGLYDLIYQTEGDTRGYATTQPERKIRIDEFVEEFIDFKSRIGE